MDKSIINRSLLVLFISFQIKSPCSIISVNRIPSWKSHWLLASSQACPPVLKESWDPTCAVKPAPACWWPGEVGVWPGAIHVPARRGLETQPHSVRVENGAWRPRRRSTFCFSHPHSLSSAGNRPAWEVRSWTIIITNGWRAHFSPRPSVLQTPGIPVTHRDVGMTADLFFFFFPHHHITSCSLLFSVKPGELLHPVTPFQIPQAAVAQWPTTAPSAPQKPNNTEETISILKNLFR